MLIVAAEEALYHPLAFELWVAELNESEGFFKTQVPNNLQDNIWWQPSFKSFSFA
jgi:hypothetical protein